MRALLATLALCLLPLAAQAQERTRPPDLPPGEDQIEAMAARGTAPFAGMLLSTDTAIRWTNRLRWWQETFDLRLSQQAEILDAVRRSHSTQLDLVRGSYEREILGLREDLRSTIALYERQVARYRNPPFYETWAFAFGTGVVVVSAVVGVIAGLVAGL